MQRLRHLKLILSGMVLTLATQARAVDQYRLEIPAAVMAGDQGVPFTVHPLKAGQPDTSTTTVRFLNLPAGLTVTPSGGLVQGPTVFRLTVGPAAAGVLLLQVRNAAEGKAAGSATIEVQPPVASFEIAPTGPVANLRTGQEVKLQIIARDAEGQLVTAFRDNVDLVASFGSVTPAVVPGETFKDGAAVVAVSFNATHAFTNRNRLEVRAQRRYGAQSIPAVGAIEIAVKDQGAAK